MQTAAAVVRRHDIEIARRISAALAVDQSHPPTLPPATVPACHILPELLSDPQSDLMSHLAGCRDDLHWRQAGFGKLPEPAAQKLAVTELIGPNGMFPAPDIRIGLLIQTGGFHYPKHQHAAAELYLILKGTACWGIEDEPPGPRAPGDFVHHKSQQPHRIITSDEPLLALWGWVGDIDGASYSV
ncbi:conserved hypothetical protein [Roseobacter denitrificans OCh 114]|uniref:Uncharacterized protein n=2 Tax=Roseobacter denitrificans TaxID=2434 RepID=Q161L3_ROSDO|nr:conserved hypothetical protein [Roseobacter denitrificans OCh 114]